MSNDLLSKVILSIDLLSKVIVSTIILSYDILSKDILSMTILSDDFLSKANVKYDSSQLYLYSAESNKTACELRISGSR